MSTPSTNPPESQQPRDAAYWAQQTSLFKVTRVPTGALDLNVEGRQGMSPLQGFGQMWQKVFRVRLQGIEASPSEVIKIWKENFPKFWPKGNRFHAPLTGIAPGEVALLRLAPGGMPLSTGVMVLYADDESFTLMTPQGHVFAGWITFSAYEDEGCTVAQAAMLIRANDPLYELGMRFGGHKAENQFWIRTLTALAAHFGLDKVRVVSEITCLDSRVQWSEAKNIWQNAAVRTMIYTMSAPVRWVRRRGRR
ncbi:MAG TPA: hypothetical protein VFA41_22580 [Ktedonobacteraceae bacterium]|jgi:hypothetical protein|nr:hypothetical protein [Ktedonobacteraceae bacterium]